ncbi:iron-containing alcohol dehydrogenase [Clostridium sp. AL.422]|uniref:iron-containing alcohol dehydrogenase n=1 Tax=Clostridium TaxID=1485 RepID=UPI00293DBE8F|nr:MULTISPECIES: iron-containing alcohol dehydrogenase [unclassified Clostridium]MDV4150279.1 iron-containing alcohol dehydrogenase [Clostridium sp. AL.422]
MSEIMNTIDSLKGKCSCGLHHETTIKDIRIGSGLVQEVGNILKENSFPKNILLVADKNTIEAADGILESLNDFNVFFKIYDFIRVATMEHVKELEKLVKDRDIGILSVGTGSINDPCRLAAANQNKKLCIFATGPSMDGFASYSSPILENGFKNSFPAKSPEVIIGDTKILANAPSELKSAGFGDMIAKNIALVDWKISNLLTGEIYCEKVATLTRRAVDELVEMADRVTVNDEHTAGKIFEALLKTGIGMSFMQNSRPASGSEHIISHLIECIELQDGIIPNLHGDDVGVCTLEMLKYYNELARHTNITAQKEKVKWEEVYEFYGPLADDVKKLNHPDNIIDCVTPKRLEELWPKIIEIIKSIPSYEVCKSAMERAGCKITVADIGKSQNLFDDCVLYSPYMRKRLTLLRLNGMIS